MGGHLFVLWGDLTLLRCSAVLIPCDTDWKVVWRNWSAVLPERRFGPPDLNGWRPLVGGGGDGRFTDVVTGRAGTKGTGPESWVRLVVTARGRGHMDDDLRARWVTDGVVEAITGLKENDIARVGGRVKPLIGLPLVGTGDGGFATTRGALIRELIPTLREAARDCDVDVALVLNDERDHAAVQSVRTKNDWTELVMEQPRGVAQLSDADSLGDEAAHGHLSLFLGSGVSVPLGLPDWKTLLSKIDPDDMRKFEPFDPEKAPDIAQEIEAKIGRPALLEKLVEQVRVPGVAPTHMLLAALSVGQAVTTNYDTAYEHALDTTVGEDDFGKKKYRVLTKQLASQPEPWLLKLHGCVTRTEFIVITREDYTRLLGNYGALQAVVESLMMTSHLMFVGFSMGDPNFVEAAKRVRTIRRLAEDSEHQSPVATVLALDRDSVSQPEGFKVVPMLDKGDDRQEAARILEIFLDYVSWKATTAGAGSARYLLDPKYQDLFDKQSATPRLRSLLSDLVAEFRQQGPACDAPDWRHVEELLKKLGARPEDREAFEQ